MSRTNVRTVPYVEKPFTIFLFSIYGRSVVHLILSVGVKIKYLFCFGIIKSFLQFEVTPHSARTLVYCALNTCSMNSGTLVYFKTRM